MGLAYLFAASGAGRLTGKGFEPVDLPPRGIVAVPAASPEFVLEDASLENASGASGSLDLIRITPNWPEGPLPDNDTWDVKVQDSALRRGPKLLHNLCFATTAIDAESKVI